MKFYIGTAFLNTPEVIEVAKVADDLGYDGWIGDLIKIDDAIAAATRLRQLRAENGLAAADVTILTPLTDAATIADYQRAEEAGITAILTMPWMFYAGPNATLAEKVDGMKRFREDLALDG